MLPSAKITFADGRLGVVTAGAGRTQLLVGISAGGVPGVVQACSSRPVSTKLLKAGPLYDAVYSRVGKAGAKMLAVNVPINAHGSVSAFTQAGTGAGAVSASAAPFESIRMKVATGGTLTNAAVQFSVNGGAWSEAVLTGADPWSHRVVGTLATVTLAAGTYVKDDIYTIATTGAVTKAGTGPDSVTCTASPVDAYRILVTIVEGGARGTAQFTYSLDGGTNTSAPIVTAATVVIPDSGIVLAFTDATYVALDTYSATATAASYTTGAAQTAIETALAGSQEFELIDIVGMPANAAAALAMASMLDTQVQAAKNELQVFLAGCVSCPTVEADATVTAAFAAFTSAEGRVAVGVGTCDITSAATGLSMRRPIMWGVMDRLATTRRCEHPGKTLLGSLTGVTAIQPAYGGGPTADTFDDARFTTLRVFPRVPGIYVTRGATMALATSDYAEIQAVRVINRAATIAQAGLFMYLNSEWRIDPDSGKLDARDVALIEGKVEHEIVNAMTGQPSTAKDEISSAAFVLDPDADLLSDATLTGTINVIPKGYSSQISATIGFTNPRLAAA